MHLNGSGLVDSVKEEIIDFIHGATPSGDNERVCYPGERTLLTRKLNREKGIPVEPSIWQEVLEM
jgi:3-dehydro-L-gulonate 2-dehydrogenase